MRTEEFTPHAHPLVRFHVFLALLVHVHKENVLRGARHDVSEGTPSTRKDSATHGGRKYEIDAASHS